MKKTTTLLCIALLLLPIAFAIIPTPYEHFKFENSTLGEYNHLTPVAGYKQNITYSTSAPVGTKAADFNGNNSYFRVQGFPKNVTNLTIMFYVKPYNKSSNIIAFDFRSPTTDTPVVNYYGTEQVGFDTEDGLTGYFQISDFGTIPEGEWSHVTMTLRDGKATNIYINGTNTSYYGFYYTTMPMPIFDGEVTFGKKYNYNLNHFNGSIDDVKFWLNYSMTGQEINTTLAFNKGITIDNCSAGYDNLKLNLTVYDEQSPSTRLEAEMDVVIQLTDNIGNDYYYKNQTLNLNGQSSYPICITPANNPIIDAQIYYNTSGGYNQKYYLWNANVATLQKVSLYNFQSTVGLDELRGVLRSFSFDYYPDITTKLERYFPTEDTWRTVQMDKSDSFGALLFHVIEGTTTYRLIFQNEGTEIDRKSNMKFLCDATDICEVTFIVVPTSTTITDDLQIVGSYDNTTEIYTVTFNDVTGLTNAVWLEVMQQKGDGAVLVCNTTSTSNSGTLTCNTTGYYGTLKATVYSSQSPYVTEVVNYMYKLTTKFFNLLEDDGLKFDAQMWANGILITLTVAGALVSAGLALLLLVAGLIITYMMGLIAYISIPWITIVAVMAIVINILVKNK